MIRPLVLLAAAALACAPAPRAERAAPPDGPPMQGAVLELGAGDDAVTVEMAGAWVADDASGRAVDVRAEVPGAPALSITAQRSTWDLAAGTMVFEGEVRLERGAVTLTCERLEATYDDEHLQRAVATGEVRIQRALAAAEEGPPPPAGEAAPAASLQRARARRAVLDPAKGTVALTGDPVLSQGPRTLRGESMTLHLDDDRVECDRCRLQVDDEAGGR